MPAHPEGKARSTDELRPLEATLNSEQLGMNTTSLHSLDGTTGRYTVHCFPVVTCGTEP